MGRPSTSLNLQETAAAVEEKRKLQQHFGRFDMLFFLICTLVGVDTIGAVASKGGEAFTWLIFLGVFFFIPYALLTAELGSAFPEEGGPYIWPRLAFGRFAACINSIIYWIANPVWVGGLLAITAIATYSTFFIDIQSNTAAKYIAGLLFIWFTVVSAIISFKQGKWIPTIGAWCRVTVLSFFTLSVVIYAFKHGVHGLGAGSFGVSYVGFIGLVPLLFFNYVGFELPSAAGEEMKDPQRDVPFAVLRSAFASVLLYGGPILAILVVLPKSQISGLSGFLDAIKAVFTVYGGHITKSGTVLTGAGKGLGYVMAIAFILTLATSGATWIMGSDRAEAIAALDGSGPRLMGTFSARFGTPIVVNVISGIVSTLVLLLTFHFTDSPNKYFTVVLGLAISTTTISYLAIFPALYWLRRKMPDVERPYRVPGGDMGALIVSVLCEVWALLASVVLLWPGFGVGWFGTHGNPNDSLASGFTRTEYELTQLVPLVVLIAVGVLFYVMGAPTRARVAATPPSIPPEGIATSPA